MADFLGIIPARYASTRFPGKPLVLLGNKPMIQWVYERASSLFKNLLVATDDQRIYDAVEDFGGKVLMTSPEHSSGTERCAEAARIYEKQGRQHFSHVVNIQGDEPLIEPEQLKTVTSCFRDPGTGIATLIRPGIDAEELKNPNVVKVVVDQSFQALYFSRAPIPYIRNGAAVPDGGNVQFYTHVGIYAFRREVLEQLVSLTPTVLEQAESLEQLRWLEHGISIQTAVSNFPTLGVDTPEDLELIRKKGAF